MVRARLRVLPPLPANVKKHPLPFAIHKFARPELCEYYVQSLEQKLSDWSLPVESTTEECCNLVLPILLRSLLVEEFALAPNGVRRVLTC